MEYNIVFYLIIGIVVVDFMLERVLDYLNTRKMSTEIPEPLKDVFDAEQYKKQQEYKKVNNRYGMITSTFSLVVILLMLFLGGFQIADSWAREITPHPIWMVLIFFGILALATDVINTPFSIYDIFVIEERFGFNKMTPSLYVWDKIKGWFLGAIIGGGLLAVVTWFYFKTGNLFWIYVWILATSFSLFMAMFYSSLIVPLFNKQTPLPEGELRDAIQAFSEKAGFNLMNIFVIDGSKRSTKANAYFTGLGPKKRIVLYDTLINDLSTEEIVAVLAHEIGHYKKRHSLTGIIAVFIQTGITLFILSLLIKNPLLSEALGGSQPSFHLGLIAFGVLFSPISLLTGMIMNQISRKHEYEADRFVKDHGKGSFLISALKKLSSKNLSNLTPHPAYVFFHYSHPTLLQRVIKLS
jgi:STE24 endopeptidase